MTDQTLIKLAHYVVKSVRLNANDRESPEDCVQEAYVTGLAELRKAEEKNAVVSTHILRVAMQRAVFRMLGRDLPEPLEDVAESKPATDQASADAREFLQVHLKDLTPKERRTVNAFLSGETAASIAAREGLTTHGVYKRMRSAVATLKAIHQGDL